MSNIEGDKKKPGTVGIFLMRKPDFMRAGRGEE
jgi:hypothetical protein